MDRFARFDPDDVAEWLRTAQEQPPVTDHMVCPKCKQPFLRSEVTKPPRSGKYVPGHYRLTCPKCDQESSYREFDYIDAPDVIRGRGQMMWDPDKRIIPTQMSPQQMTPNRHDRDRVPLRSGPWTDNWSNRPTIGRSQI